MSRSSSKSTRSWTETEAEARLPPVANRSVWLERLVVAVVLLLIVWGIGSYGMWDPWELGKAEAARQLLEGNVARTEQLRLSTRLISTAFGAFGVHAWSGRLPGVLAGLLTCWLAFVLIRTAESRRAAVTAIVVLASTPAFLLGVHLLMGSAVEVAAQSWVGVAAIGAISTHNTPIRKAGYYVLFGAGVIVSALASGVLLGPLPPVLAVATWSLVSEGGERADALGRWIFPAAAVVSIVGIARAVALDAPEAGLWLGGGSVGGNPPTYDKALEVLFHGLAPWSAVLPVAAASTLAPKPSRDDQAQSLGWILFLWAAFAFVSWTLFASRYGTPPYLALVPLTALVAIWMTEVSEEPVARWPAAVIVVLLMGLLIRDYALYPESPLRALGADDLAVPDVYDPKRWWAFLFVIQAVVLALFLVSHEGVPRPCPRRVVRWFRRQWSSGWAARVWMLLGGWLLAICFVFGLMCLVLDLRIASLLVRVGRVAFFLPFVLAALVFGLPWLRHAYGKLRAAGIFPVLLGGLSVGAFLVLSFQPALSQHFSPKQVYDAYVELTAEDHEPLAVYRVQSTAAYYYTSVPIEQIENEAEALAFLGRAGRRWVVMPAEQLPQLDRSYRQKTGKHLYVADARSARLLLIASVPVEGRPNASFLEAAVLREAPDVQHRVTANYQDRIELVGYDMSLPGGDSVGAGERFEITWYWRVLDDPPAGYTVFVHIDREGLRLNADHEPVAGRYPATLWQKGDVIVDTQEILVPANFPPGDYPIYAGWFRGNDRLEVRSGPQDGADRVRAGVLSVR